jgi:flagellar motor switch/type III secretory pathway protein FliN
LTELAQSTRAAELEEAGEVRDSADPSQQPESGRRGPRGSAAVGGWRVIGWLVCGVAGGLAIAWFIFLSPGEVGSKAEWFFGAVVFVSVLVSMWQTVNIQRQIQRQAKQDAAEAAERLHQQLAAAEERSARDLAQTQALHRAEMEAQQKLHRAEMEAQCELARVERILLLKQLQKQAMIEVSRAVGAHTQMLATLWNRGASILRIEDRDEREEAMKPIFEQISQVVNDFSVELGNAHLFIEDDRLQHTLNQVNEAALMAIRVAEEVHDAVVEGRVPQPNPIPPVQRLMHARASEARRLAWDLLRTGLDDSGRPTRT